MKRDNKFVLRLAGLTLIIAAMILPLVQVNFSASWVDNNAPIAAPTGFKTKLLDYNVVIERQRIVTYDNSSLTFIPHEGNKTVFSDEVDSFDFTIRLLYYGGVLLAIAGLALSAFYNDKIGKILVLLGGLMTLAVLYFTTQMRDAVYQALLDSGRTKAGTQLYTDTTFSDGVNTYTWRNSAIVEIGLGYYTIAIGSILMLIGEILPTSKPSESSTDSLEETDE